MKTFIKGFLPIEEFGSKLVEPLKNKGNKVFVWRNSVVDNYKVGEAYQQEPLDLSNFLFIRTRERQLLLNKLNSTSQTVTTGLRITRKTTEESLVSVNKEISRDLDLLHRIIYIRPDATQVPIAFATNSLYIFERNGGANREAYLDVLLPILRAKAEFLHAEGLSQTVWALSNAGVYDQDIWETLKK